MAAPRQPASSRHIVDLAWRFGALAAWLLLALRFWWVCDDAYISFRYGRNWASGLGLRFNPGEHVPVEGYTNFLWTAASAAVERMAARPDRVLPVLSCACAAALLVRYHALLVRELRLSPSVAGLALLGLAVFPPFAVWSTSGLETMAFCLCLFLACEGLLVRRTRGVGAGLAALAAALLRFDGVAFGVALAACGLLLPSGRDAAGLRRTGRYLAILLAGFLVYYAWRFHYYEAAFPNTVYAKVGLGGDVLARGARYVASFALTFLSPLALLAALPVAFRGRFRAWALPVAGALAASVAYPVATGGDFMAMGRFLMPATVLGALLVAPLLAEVFARSRVGGWALAVGLVLVAELAGFGHALLPERALAAFRFRYNSPAAGSRSEYEQWEFMKRTVALWAQEGKAMRRVARPGESWVVGPLGATGYFSGLVTWDQAGLVVPEIARREASGALRSPGHDKLVPLADLVAWQPDYLLAWPHTGRCVIGPVDKELPAAGAGALRAPAVASRYAPEVLPVSDPEVAFSGLLVLRRVEDAGEREALWRAFDADRPEECRFDAPRGERS